MIGVIVVGLWWANNSASSTQQKVQSQLKEAAQEQKQLAETETNKSASKVTSTTSRKEQSDPVARAKSTTSESDDTNQGTAPNGSGPDWKHYEKPSQEKLKARLDPLVYEVTQEDGTESAYDNELWDEEREGIYVDVLSGEPLFSSKNKYKSGTGWPSFTKPLEPANITTEADYVLGYRRTEVRSKYGDNHLGHVFNDGPETMEASGGAAPTGLRYCLNSAALEFIPKEDMQEEGYGEYLSIFNQKNT